MFCGFVFKCILYEIYIIIKYIPKVYIIYIYGIYTAIIMLYTLHIIYHIPIGILFITHQFSVSQLHLPVINNNKKKTSEK